LLSSSSCCCYSVSIRGSVTDTTGVTGGEGDVTTVTPRSTPRVLDAPVSGVVDTGQEDTMVEVGSTVSEHTSGIEGPVGGINGDGNGSSTEGIDDLVTVSGSTSGSVSLNVVRSTLNLTGTILGGVSVRSLIGDTVLRDVLEGVVHPTTIASLVSEGSGTINELLLGEGGGTGALDSLQGLDGSDGGEGPARTARSLVLHSGHLTGGNPVDGGVGGGGD